MRNEGTSGAEIGMGPYYVKVISIEASGIIGLETVKAPVKQVAPMEFRVHIAVRFGNRIFDAFTGPGGIERPST